MKKIKFEGKLSLNKETVAKLNDEQMSKIHGGAILWTLIKCTPKPAPEPGTIVGQTCVTVGVSCTCPPAGSEAPNSACA